MNSRQQRSFSRLQNVKLYLTMERSLDDMPRLYSASLNRLESSIKRVDELASRQALSSPMYKRDGRQVAELRRVLRRQYMIPLVRTARRELLGAPGAERALVVPHASRSHGEVVAAAERLLKYVRPHQKLLTSAGFDRSFFAELRERVRELKHMTTTTAEFRTAHARATRELRLELQRANETVRIIDGLLLARADRNDHLAARWKHATRLPKRIGRPKANKPRLSPVDEPGVS